MYILTFKSGAEYTIPKENIVLLALSKAIEIGYDKPIKTNEQAIEFLKDRMDIEIREV